MVDDKGDCDRVLIGHDVFCVHMLHLSSHHDAFDGGIDGGQGENGQGEDWYEGEMCR